MKIIENISRILILFRTLLSTSKESFCDNKTVLIVFQQIFGDSIIIQSSLKEYEKIFPKSQGYNIIFLARPSVLKFMKETLPIPKGIRYEVVDFKKFLANYKYFKTIIDKYNNKVGTIIVPGTSLSAEIFSCAINAKRKIGLVRPIALKRPFFRAYIARIAYNEIVRPNKEDMMLKRHSKLLAYLGSDNYKTILPSLIKQKKIIYGKYAVICPGASKLEKCWPIERFAIIADYIHDKFGYDVHLCGGENEAHFGQQIINLVKYPNGIVDHIGKTSFSEWSSIVQYASIVIGNDSATMHLAAAASVPSVCIAGGYDKFQFFPYDVDITENNRTPLTLLKDVRCQWCRTIGYDAGYGNDKCKKQIKKCKPALCISEIMVEDVIKAIEHLLNDTCSKL